MTLAEVTTQICSLVRNIVLANVLTKADFGIAAILGMTISLIEFGARLSIEHLVIQSQHGDQPRFVAVAQLVQATLGAFSTVTMLLVAVPIAGFFGVPEATWAFQLLALVPLLRSLAHLDIYRFHRHLRFGPGALAEVVPQVITTLLVWPLTTTWQSYTAFVWLLLAKQAASTAASHLLAERPYRWSYDRQIVQSILSFGWPMLINGLLFFAIMQGDRFAIGIRLSVADLGVYAVAGTLALLPAGALLKISAGLMLPLLSPAKGDPGLFERRLGQISQVMSVFSSLYAILMILAGGPLIHLIFGAKYSDAGVVAAWLGLAQAIRLLRGVPTIASIALGDTKNLMFSNLWRLSGLMAAFPLAFAGASLATIAACASLGEFIALIASFARFSRQHASPFAIHIPGWSLAFGFTLTSATLAWLGLPKMASWIPLLGAASLGISALLLYLAVFKESRNLLFAKLLPQFGRFASTFAL